MFLKSAWYVAAQSGELGEKPLGRKICGESMVFYRGEQGRVAAVQDFCPHRGAPLSLGFVAGGRLVCGYHGLEMGCDGKTRAMPGQRVQGFPPIKSYAVVERHGFIWVWPGEAALADASAIPQFPWLDNPEWTFGGGMFRIECSYLLMIDNLMDLSHETYVHATSIGQKEIDENPAVTRVEGDTVITSRYMNGIQAPPFWQMALRANDLPDNAAVDRWQVCRFSPPSHVMIDVGVALAGKGGYAAAPEFKASSVVVDFITPESETSILYFWGMARHFKPGDEALTASIREGQGKIFAEDLEMLERQQKNLLAFPERKLLMLNIDSGGVQSRRVLDRLIAQEQAAAAASIAA